ncbi:superoxide dismutase [Desulfolutivibrio sp.]|uniref:superoxide dismutase n=1 Tax=Desulfolutivibrio sp. TaxID=2773296 RepID=UPI002F968618
MTSESHPASLSRREFMGFAAGAGLVLSSLSAMSGLVGLSGTEAFAADGPVFALPPLPYAENALEPHISARTVSFHYGKHTKAYYDNANELLKAVSPAPASLSAVFLAAGKDPAALALFNNAAQAFNHTFYWKGLTPGGPKAPAGKLAELITASFGDFEAMKKELAAASVSQFGSGWGWLVLDGGALKVVKTLNAANPLQNGQKPILTVDVWEHAYYLDYQNRRADYVKAALDNLVNWDVAAANLG